MLYDAHVSEHVMACAGWWAYMIMVASNTILAVVRAVRLYTEMTVGSWKT